MSIGAINNSVAFTGHKTKKEKVDYQKTHAFTIAGASVGAAVAAAAFTFAHKTGQLMPLLNDTFNSKTIIDGAENLVRVAKETPMSKTKVGLIIAGVGAIMTALSTVPGAITDFTINKTVYNTVASLKGKE